MTASRAVFYATVESPEFWHEPLTVRYCQWSGTEYAVCTAAARTERLDGSPETREFPKRTARRDGLEHLNGSERGSYPHFGAGHVDALFGVWGTRDTHRVERGLATVTTARRSRMQVWG